MDDRRETEARTQQGGAPRVGDIPAEMQVRDEDLEPHAGLRYIARLFKVLSLLLIILLAAEAVIGLMREGSDSVPTLLVEATRLIVFAGLLWGAADMALMLIESNHDLRATRILVGRLNGKVQRMEEASGLYPPRVGASPPPPVGPPPSPPGPPPA